MPKKKEKSQKGKSNTPLLVVILMIVLFFSWKLGLLPIGTDEEVTVQRPSRKQKGVEQEPEPPKVEAFKGQEPKKLVEAGAEEQEKKVELAPPSKDFFKEKVDAQVELKKQYLDLVKAEIDLPKDMNYTVVDSEDDIGIIYGRDQKGQKEFAMLATTRKVSVEESLAYLKENPSALPLMNGVKMEGKGQVQKIPAPASSGLGPLTLIKIGEVAGKDVFAAFTKRSDEEGSYMFLMKAPTDFYDANEGYLDNLLSTFKTKNP